MWQGAKTDKKKKRKNSRNVERKKIWPKKQSGPKKKCITNQAERMWIVKPEGENAQWTPAETI